PPEDDGGIATTIQDSVINRLNLRSEETGGILINSTAIFDPDTGTIKAVGQQRSDFVRTTLLSARAYPNPARYAQQFSSLLKKKQDRDVIDGLKIIAPNLQRIEVVSESIGPSIYLDIGQDALVPLTVSGEGMVRMFSIILELISSRNGVFLIDEIDNGLHHTAMPKLWKLLGALVEKHDVQIFATTHNDDMMRSALEAFAGTEGMLGLFRIDKRGERHVMVSYSEEAMKGILEDHFEVRG
ncbi:MAG: AAA family ATPase, partial [Isosphaeraceae bacterium]